MVYNIIVSEITNRQLDNILAYIVYVFCDIFTATKIYQDYINTLNLLAISADGYKKYTDGPLKDYYKISFKNHNYIILYKIEHRNVYVEHIYHMLQDYGNSVN